MKKITFEDILIAIPIITLAGFILYESIYQKDNPVKEDFTKNQIETQENQSYNSILPQTNISEGSQYDSDLSSHSLSQDELRALAPWKFTPSEQLGGPGYNPIFIGNKVDKDFGKSKYDKNTNWEDLVYGERSLEDRRTERRNAEIKSITINIGIGGLVVALIMALIMAAKKK